MKQLTITLLKKLCDLEIKKGNGNRMIVISDDNEGSGFHGLFYGFTTIDKKEKDFYQVYDSQSDDVDKIIILG